MHTFEIPALKIYREYPETIDELTPEQYLYFLQRLQELEAGKISSLDFRIGLICHFLDIKRGPKKPKIPKFILEENAIAQNLYLLAETLDSFLVRDENNNPILALHSIKDLLSPIAIGGNIWHGPGDLLQKLSFGEFIQAHAHLAAYKDGDSNAIYRMAVQLYRPQDPNLLARQASDDYNGDPRAPLNAALEEKLTNFLIQSGHPIPRAALILFNSALQHFTTHPLRVQGNDISLSILYERGSSKSKSGLPSAGLVDVLFTLSESGVFGNAKQTAKENLFSVLLRLYQISRQAKEDKIAAKNAKGNRT